MVSPKAKVVPTLSVKPPVVVSASLQLEPPEEAAAYTGGIINLSNIAGAASNEPAIAERFSTFARNSLRVTPGVQAGFSASGLTSCRSISLSFSSFMSIGRN